jgi:hypothetical protein
MSEPDPFTAKPRAGSDHEANSSVAALNLAMTLMDAVDQLALQHGGLGPWFDEFEARSIKNAKNVDVRGIAMGTEADAIQFGVDTLKAAFASARSRLAKRYL